jgi:site-specific DNA recombinase|tara:strand:- start:493 stop:1287 length:795 start_codon:yes stop_codon:yes gene_type:complete
MTTQSNTNIGKYNILYSRVSTKTQEDNTSLDYQKCNLLSYCNHNSIPNYIHIVDVDSGSIERNGIKEIKELIADGLVDTIYITKLDRLYRSIVEGSAFIKLCLDSSVNIITTLETTDTTTSTGMLQINLLMSIADYERNCIADRTWSGKVSTFTNGNRPHGNIPYGYTKKNNELTIVSAEANLIKEMFYTYSDYKSLSKVKLMLDGVGATTRRNKPFSRKSIYNILKNKLYIGSVSLQDETTSGTHQTIVSKHIFTRVNNLLSS